MRGARIALAGAALCASLAACGGGSGETLRVSVRVPGGSARASRAILVSAVRLTITGVRVHHSDAAGPEDADWVDCGPRKALQLDLLALGGKARELCADRIPDGYYRQIRVDLAENAEDGTPPANTVVTASGEELPLDVWGAGFGVGHGFLAGGGGVVDIVLDINAEDSVERRPGGRLVFLPDIAVSATKYYGAVAP